MFSKSHNSPCLNSLQSEIFVAHAVIYLLWKSYKSTQVKTQINEKAIKTHKHSRINNQHRCYWNQESLPVCFVHNKYKIWQQTLNSNSKQAFVYPLWPLCWPYPDNLWYGLLTTLCSDKHRQNYSPHETTDSTKTNKLSQYKSLRANHYSQCSSQRCHGDVFRRFRWWRWRTRSNGFNWFHDCRTTDRLCRR